MTPPRSRGAFGGGLRRGVVLALPVAVAWSGTGVALAAPVSSRTDAHAADSVAATSAYPSDDRPIILGQPETTSAPASAPNDDAVQSRAARRASQGNANFGGQDQAPPRAAASSVGDADTAANAGDAPAPFALDPAALPMPTGIDEGRRPGRGAARDEFGLTADNRPTLGFQQGAYGGGCAAIARSGGFAMPGESATMREQPNAPVRSRRRAVQATLSGSETYSDNITLASEDSERHADFVTTVAPRLDACSTTGRFRGEFSYQLQGVVYANDSRYNDVYNDIDSDATFELVKRHLYLDADTRYGQQVIDPSLGYADSNIIRPNQNKTTSWVSNVSPYLVQDLGAAGTGQLRYRYGRSIYDDDTVPDTTAQSVFASLTSPDTAQPLSWQASVVTQWVDTDLGNPNRYLDSLADLFPGLSAADLGRDRDRTQHFDTATVQLGYNLSPRLQLTVLGGVEDKYRDNGDNDRWSAPRYQAGLRYTTATNTLAFNVGHRFYGESYQLLVAHQTRNIDFNLSYREDPSTSGLDSLDGGNGGAMFGSIGSQIGLGGTGYRNDFGNGNSLLNREVYVNKRWNANMRVHTPLTDTDLRAFFEEQESQDDEGPDTRYHGIELDTRYAFRPRMSAVPSFRWTHYEQGLLSTGSSDEYEANLSVVRALTPSLDASVGYGRTWRDGAFDYTENRATLQLRQRF
ncbi:TIGR03016 family PEP-CTERM system-associated outer membrane protein [Salinisphaera sp. Q1T1-3]|uniref:TIGR03016 family PEP-CTERM system-associated outer membrane protein n=1 Tax=Salinisphaera sp. Q1T1-3 TaxID=2321229 RepID=UPI001314F003|nr:TIGR03016 family PEP-CTERM system-associated outer membrane protein [Salinisphaera sp. Q1T1-3]